MVLITDAKNVGSSTMLWYHLVENYSNRDLTVEADRLAALAGLAEKCQREQWHKGRYLAGLWEGDLPAALLWTGGYRWGLDDEPPSKGPSWFWASSLLPDNISWPRPFLRGEARIEQDDDCTINGDRIYLSTDSKAANSDHGRLTMSAFLQPLTARFLAQLALPDLDNSEELDPPLPERLGDVKGYWTARETEWTDRGEKWTQTEDFRSMVTCELRKFRSWRTIKPFWSSAALDRNWDTFMKPLYFIKICSWPCHEDDLDEKDTSEYVESHFLLLTPINVDASDDSDEEIAEGDRSEAFYCKVALHSSDKRPQPCFKRAEVCAYTHKKGDTRIMDRAVRQEIILI